MARSRESSPLLSRAYLAGSKEVLFVNHLVKWSTLRLLDSMHYVDKHPGLVRTLAVLLEAKCFETVAEKEQRQHLQKQQGERILLSFPRSATTGEIQMKDTKLLACFSDKSELQYSKAPPESVYDLSKFFFCQANSNEIERLLFLPRLRAVQSRMTSARTVEDNA